MKKYIVTLALVLSFVVAPFAVDAQDMSIKQLVELFIALGVISPDKAQAARTAVGSVPSATPTPTPYPTNLPTYTPTAAMPYITNAAGKAAGNFEIDAGGTVGILGSNLLGGRTRDTRVYIADREVTTTQLGDDLIYATAPSDLQVGSYYSLYLSNDKGRSNTVRVKVISVLTSTPSSTPLPSSTPTTQPSVTILTPNGGESYAVGQPVSVRWKTNNLPQNASSLLYIADDRTPGWQTESFFGSSPVLRYAKLVSSNGTENVYEYTFTVPQNFNSSLPSQYQNIFGGNHYKMNITVMVSGEAGTASQKVVNDVSDGTFSLGVSSTQTTYVTNSVPGNSCTGLQMVWEGIGRRDAYSFATDQCDGYRIVTGTTISPSCYNKSECQSVGNGTCVYIPSARLQCPASIQSTPTATPTATVNTVRRSQINALYEQYLNREAEQAGLDYWDQGGLSIDQVRQGILNSWEYNNITHPTPTATPTPTYTPTSSPTPAPITILSPRDSAWSLNTSKTVEWTPFSGDFDRYDVSFGNTYAPNVAIAIRNVPKTSNSISLNLYDTIIKIAMQYSGKTEDQIKDGYFVQVIAWKFVNNGQNVEMEARGKSNLFTVPITNVTPTPSPTYTPTPSYTPTPTYTPVSTPVNVEPLKTNVIRAGRYGAIGNSTTVILPENNPAGSSNMIVYGLVSGGTRPYTCYWDLGDGQGYGQGFNCTASAQGQRFTAAGDYPWKFKATDASGRTSETTFTVHVLAPATSTPTPSPTATPNK